jgi:hypothetical protein
MELRRCHRFHPAPTVIGTPRIVESPPLISNREQRRSGFVPAMKDFIDPWREEQIFRFLLDGSGADRQSMHNTSRQKYLPSLIDEE